MKRMKLELGKEGTKKGMKSAKALKRGLCIFLAAMLVFALAACGSEEEPSADAGTQAEQTAADEGNAQDSQTPKAAEGGKNILIAYFSWAENAEQENIDAMTSPSVKKPGDVARLASWVREETGGHTFSIQVTDPYPANWDGCLERGNEEKSKGTRPALTKKIENLEDYDIIFLGYPNWWYSCPMALITFFEENDLSGKQVYLFCSHGTGGLASSVEDIKAAIPRADISDKVFDVYEEDAAGAKDELLQWVKSLGI